MVTVAFTVGKLFRFEGNKMQSVSLVSNNKSITWKCLQNFRQKNEQVDLFLTLLKRKRLCAGA